MSFKLGKKKKTIKIHCLPLTTCIDFSPECRLAITSILFFSNLNFKCYEHLYQLCKIDTHQTLIHEGITTMTTQFRTSRKSVGQIVGFTSREPSYLRGLSPFSCLFHKLILLIVCQSPSSAKMMAEFLVYSLFCPRRYLSF